MLDVASSPGVWVVVPVVFVAVTVAVWAIARLFPTRPRRVAERPWSYHRR
ncbi:hypothetical protein [Cellulomonas biazotea]|nr:hypothetical protein [Cellulomonas biazotea]